MTNPEDFSTIEDFIRWLFNSRCVICYKFSREVHEIVPRSAGKESLDWKNRITLCREHHTTGKDAVHNVGVSDEVIKYLQERRKTYLTTIGRKEYI